MTALGFAAAAGHLDIVIMLSQHGAKVVSRFKITMCIWQLCTMVSPSGGTKNDTVVELSGRLYPFISSDSTWDLGTWWVAWEQHLDHTNKNNKTTTYIIRIMWKILWSNQKFYKVLTQILTNSMCVIYTVYHCLWALRTKSLSSCVLRWVMWTVQVSAC